MGGIGQNDVDFHAFINASRKEGNPAGLMGATARSTVHRSWRLGGMWRKKGRAITEIARGLSMEKFYSTVAKMQKNRMTTPKLWANFRSQNRQEVQIPAKFAVKSWEDQIFGARRRCHRTTDRDHAIPVKQGFKPCFFLTSCRPFPLRQRFSAMSTGHRRAPAYAATLGLTGAPSPLHFQTVEIPPARAIYGTRATPKRATCQRNGFPGYLPNRNGMLRPLSGR